MNTRNKLRKTESRNDKQQLVESKRLLTAH